MTSTQWHTPDADFNGEIWKTAPGFPDYSVSSKGRVLSRGKVSKKLTHGSKVAGFATVGKLLPLQDGVNGYPKVSLGRYKQVLVHRLVARAFLGPCPEGHQVKHKNGIKTDNRLENLEYSILEENPATPVSKHSRKLTEEQKEEIRARYLKGESCLNMAEDYDVYASSISAVCREVKKPKTLEFRLKTSKLTVDQIKQIKTRLAAGHSLSSIAADFPISKTTVSNIKQGKIWSQINC